MPEPVSRQESEQEQKDRREMVAKISAAVAVVVANEIRKRERVGIPLPDVSVSTITKVIIAGLILQSLIVHRAARSYARVLLNDNDPKPVDQDAVERLVGLESDYQVEFVKKAAARMVNAALDGGGQEAVKRSMEREKQILDLRMKAVRQRAVETVNEQGVRRESPFGAYWLLDESRKTHTPGCLAMAGHAWSWEILSVIKPSVMHLGCGCRLINLSLARASAMPDSTVVRDLAPRVAIDEVKR